MLIKQSKLLRIEKFSIMLHATTIFECFFPFLPPLRFINRFILLLLLLFSFPYIKNRLNYIVLNTYKKKQKFQFECEASREKWWKFNNMTWHWWLRVWRKYNWILKLPSSLLSLIYRFAIVIHWPKKSVKNWDFSHSKGSEMHWDVVVPNN